MRLRMNERAGRVVSHPTLPQFLLHTSIRSIPLQPTRNQITQEKADPYRYRNHEERRESGGWGRKEERRDEPPRYPSDERAQQKDDPPISFNHGGHCGSS